MRFFYSPALDAECDGPEIQTAWKEELEATIPRLADLWEQRGSKLAEETEALLGKPLDADVLVRLTLCDTPSQAVPLILNMRYALETFVAEPVRLEVKVGTLHHELLHRTLDDMVPADSALLARYSGHHPRVMSHLHLLALQKAVYLRLGLEADLAELIAVDSLLPGGHNKAAWDIVNAEPGLYLDFVRELTQQREAASRLGGEGRSPAPWAHQKEGASVDRG